MFLAPHSRHTEVPIEDIRNCKELTVLAESEEAGLFLAMAARRPPAFSLWDTRNTTV